MAHQFDEQIYYFPCTNQTWLHEIESSPNLLSSSKTDPVGQFTEDEIHIEDP